MPTPSTSLFDGLPLSTVLHRFYNLLPAHIGLEATEWHGLESRIAQLADDFEARLASGLLSELERQMLAQALRHYLYRGSSQFERLARVYNDLRDSTPAGYAETAKGAMPTSEIFNELSAAIGLGQAQLAQPKDMAERADRLAAAIQVGFDHHQFDPCETKFLADLVHNLLSLDDFSAHDAFKRLREVHQAKERETIERLAKEVG